MSKTLRHWREVSCRHFGTSAEMSWVRSVRTPLQRRIFVHFDPSPTMHILSVTFHAQLTRPTYENGFLKAHSVDKKPCMDRYCLPLQ